MRNADAADDGEALAPMEEGGASSSASGQRRAGSDDVIIRQGSEVRLRNLVANASLNGTAGVIREWDAGTAKWVVVLITGNVVRVKPDNVEEFKELSGGGDGEGEEARDPRVPDQLYCPSRRAQRMHRAAGHFPYRSWCPECVRAKKRELPHRRQGEVEREYNTVHADYFFPRDERGSASVTCLALKHTPSGTVRAHLIPAKGAGFEQVVNMVTRTFRQLGERGKILVKSDQEFAIGDLLESVAKARLPAETIIEAAPKGDSRANGHAERGVQTAEECVRVGMLDLEQAIGAKISVHDVVFAWLVRHMTDAHSKFHIGADGRTAYERLKGKPYAGIMLPFGEAVLHRVIGKVQGGDMRERWMDGVFLGRTHESDEALVMTMEGDVVRARSVTPREENIKVTKEMLLKLKTYPWEGLGTISHESELPERRTEEARPEGGSQDTPVPRDLRVTEAAIGKFGYTEDARSATRCGLEMTTRVGGTTRHAESA